jgi:hypothetical protein
MAKQGSADHLLYDRLLTNVVFEKGMGMPGIAGELAPRVRSTNITGQFMMRERGTKSAGVSTRRAPGAKVQTGERPGKRLETFRTVDHALSELIPQEITSGMEETELMGERRATAMSVLRKIIHDWEQEVFDLVWAQDKAGFESKYGASNVIDPTVKWDASSGINMKLDILRLRLIVYKSCGYIPNTLLIPNEVFNVITTKDNELREAIKYTQGGPVTLQKLAAYFEISNVIVPMYLRDNPEGNNEEQMELLWEGDSVGLFYVDKTASRNKDTLASTFYWDSPEQRFLGTYTGWNRKRKSEEVEVGAYFQVREIDMSCGGILADVLNEGGS